MCIKVAYLSKQAANKARLTIERSGKEMRIYQCERCHKWHLTSDLQVKHYR